MSSLPHPAQEAPAQDAPDGGGVVLVTGGSGLVLRHALAGLRAGGLPVVTVSRRPFRFPGCRHVRADLLDPAARHDLLSRLRPRILVHGAWVTAHGLFWDSAENGLWLEASRSLAHRFFALGGRRLVGIGSCAEYDWRTAPAGTPWPEELAGAGEPATPYGRARRQCLCEFRDAARAAGGEFAWARLFLLFGSEEPPGKLVRSLATALLAGREAPMGRGEGIRDFLSVEGAGAHVARLVRSRFRGAMNIGSGRPVSIRALAGRLALLCGHPELLRPGALPDREGEPPFMAPDISRLKSIGGQEEDTDAALSRLVAALAAGQN